ncbi:MAG TPA: histidinol-phosphate transaminase [Terriglobales bacterium]|nr:histidinol-phosphate transaminase [Terriglobales bacterium]
MTKFDEVVPAHIRALGGYAAGKPLKQAEKESGVRCIKMASNENPFGPSPLAIEAMREAAAEVHLYPDNEATELKNDLAARANVEPDQILLTGGSTQFLDIIGRTLLAPGLKAITSERSFIVYPISARAAGGELVQVPMQGDTFDLDAILAAIDENTRVIFIANPNNPTGTMVDPVALDRFIDRVPNYVTVVLDEAYYDFAHYFAMKRGLDFSRSLDYVRQGRNVIVLRTFSKAHGLAAVRCGYGFGPAALIRYLSKMRTAFSVSSLAEAGALAALRDEQHVQKSLDNNAAGAAWLTKKLSEMGLRVLPTWTNFLYIETAEDAAVLADRIQQEGVIIRPLTVWGAPRSIRVTVGTPEQNEKFIAALTTVMQQAAVQ